ncbi:MAG: uridine diphosphate-N-acetylglucosamine-binding protein YvcK [bacterium]|nr:uridine diphosphate-N-acetylglucosamine-binding protein YvcK [bacterium]
MNKKVIVFGGGTGLSCLLKGLKKFPVEISAVVSVCDDGGSTGKLRDEFDILAVGDIRRVLISLSDTESKIEELLNYRFKSGGSLDNHTVGNILLTAATEISGSVIGGIDLLGKVLNLEGKILPFTESNINLFGEMEDGSVVEGEHNITESSKKIKRVFYKDIPVINNKLLKEIKNSDLIVFSMGSLFTSIIPCLLSEQVINAIDDSNAKIIYTCNLFTQPGETDNYKVSDHLKILNSYLGKRKINTVICNSGKIKKEIANRYLTKEQKDIVKLDYDESISNVNNIIYEDLVVIENGYLRHDSLKLAYLIFSTLIR